MTNKILLFLSLVIVSTGAVLMIYVFLTAFYNGIYFNDYSVVVSINKYNEAWIEIFPVLFAIFAVPYLAKKTIEMMTRGD